MSDRPSFFGELKQRNVYKVAVAYAVVTWLLIGYAYAVTGRHPDALKILQKLDALEKRRFVSTISRVYVYAGLGGKDKVFEWLEKAYQERSDSLARFRFDPESKGFQSDPRFGALMRKIGFSEP
jgi:hypothetical protein